MFGQNSEITVIVYVFDARFWKMLTNHGKPPYIEADVFRKKK